MTDSSESLDIIDRSRKSWTEDEDNVLIKLVKKYGVKRWTDISKAMVDLFELTNKSGKQCRQRWVNNLDPKINKEKWTLEEERKIFDSHKIYGNKWKIIAKQLDSRTDNSIKNHFYSILRKGLRRINKMMGDRKSTEKVKQIRTSVLSNLSKLEHSSFESTKNFNVSNIYELLFQFASMSSGNISEKNLTEDLKNDFKETIVHMMSLSTQEKIKKEQNIAQKKNNKNRKNSNQMVDESSEYEQSENISQEKDLKDQQKINDDEIFISPNMKILEKENKFLVNLELSPEKSKIQSENDKNLVDEKTSEKIEFFLNTPVEKMQKVSNEAVIVLEKTMTNEFLQQDEDDQKSIDFINFPNITINIEEQSFNMSFTSNDFTNKNYFNKSPLFQNPRQRLNTPRIPSPGAFNFCSQISTAQSFGNYVNLASAGKQNSESKNHTVTFDCELDKIVQELKSNIDNNCGNPAVPFGNSGNGMRISSSRFPYAESCTKVSSIFLTPRSGSGKAH